MYEADLIIVRRESIEEAPELGDYAWRLIHEARAYGKISSPSGTLYTTSPERQDFDEALAYNTDVFNEACGELVQDVTRVVGFIVANSRVNPDQFNPYDPLATHLTAYFEENFSKAEQAIAHYLWRRECAEDLKYHFEKLSSRDLGVNVIGQVASGKTTFLKTLIRNLDLDNIAQGLEGSEPEDTEDLYPDSSTIHHYKYLRITSRGGAATFGTERTKLFGLDSGSGNVLRLEIQSQGGHLRADQIYRHYDQNPTAVFFDFQIMRKIENLDGHPLDFVLENGERMDEFILGTLKTFQRLNDLQESGIPVVCVATKVPQAVDQPDISGTFEGFKEWVLNYYSRHLHEFEVLLADLETYRIDTKFIDKITLRDLPVFMDVALPEDTKPSYKIAPQVASVIEAERKRSQDYPGKSQPKQPRNQRATKITNESTLKWVTINDDAPRYTGALQVLTELAKLAGHGNLQLVSFNENGVPLESSQVNYLEVLSALGVEEEILQ